MSKKPKYAQRWSHEASWVLVQPSLTDKAHVTIFLAALSTTYYDRLIGYFSGSFANLFQTGERIENRPKDGKPKEQKLFEQVTSSNSGSSKRAFLDKKIENDEREVHTISRQIPQRDSRFSIVAHVYRLSAPNFAHASQPFNPQPVAYLSQGRYQKAQPTKRDRILLIA